MVDPENTRIFGARPERLKETVKANPNKTAIIIDEVQKVPELLWVVHELMERNKALRIVLTGSSARKLRRQGVNLLAGRAILKTMHPFLAAELGDAFNLETALTLGMLPLVLDSNEPKESPL